MLTRSQWRTIAEDTLLASHPHRFRDLRRTGQLADLLDELAHRADAAFQRLVTEFEARNPRLTGPWVHQAAREIVVRDVILPALSPERGGDNTPGTT